MTLMLRYCIVPDYNLAYLPIAKCASTTIKRAIASVSMDAVPLRIHPDFPKELQKTELDRDQYFTFTFVRHPADRFLSFYRGKVLDKWDHAIGPTLEHLGIRAGASLREVLDALARHDPSTWEAHVRPQHLSLMTQTGTLAVDFIGRVERLQRDWNRIRAMTGLTLELSHANPTVRVHQMPISRQDYDDMMAVLEPDFRWLGYTRVPFDEIGSEYAKYGLTPVSAGN
jgi:Sulfotransferase family